MISPSGTGPRRVAILGGGISGLAAAHRVLELDLSAEMALFEAGGRLGGTLETIRQDGFLIEAGADSFITSVPWAIDLCRRLGISDQLISTQSRHRRALVLARGKLYPVPEGFVLMAPQRLGPLLRSPILSWRGKLRAACETFVKQRADAGDESLASFARRRLGRETFERLVQPLIGGIYTADPEKLSLAATMPRFLEMERRHGSLGRAMRHARSERASDAGDESGARYSMFVAPREGMSSLVNAIVERLPAGAVRMGARVNRLERAANGWHVDGERFDGVIIATPAAVAAQLLDTVDGALSAELRAIQYAGSAVVALGYDRGQIAHALDGFGFVVPAIENRRILSASFSSVKFAGRAPDGQVLIRAFLGGALQPQMLDLSDAELARTAEQELRDLPGITGAPLLSIVFRWPHAMPQYHLGHVDRVKRIGERMADLPGLALAGNAYAGVGIPHCIHSGETAAEKALRIRTGE